MHAAPVQIKHCPKEEEEESQTLYESFVAMPQNLDTDSILLFISINVIITLIQAIAVNLTQHVFVSAQPEDQISLEAVPPIVQMELSGVAHLLESFSSKKIFRVEFFGEHCYREWGYSINLNEKTKII